MLTHAELLTLRAAHIVLASSSPRRVEIINRVLKLEAEVIPSTFEEDLDKSLFTPDEYVKENAKQKALEVFTRLGSGQRRSLIVGADTVVVLGDRILEKPADAEHAKRMLAELVAARDHRVCSGVALLYADGSCRTFSESTKVAFAPDLSAEAIAGYVESGEPMDKAGGYGIQGGGGSFVEGIEGCYFNVVGFPMHRFCREVREGLAQIGGS